MLKMKGIGASNGIALAKVLILKHEAIKTDTKKINEKEITVQLKKLHDGLNAAGKEIKKLIKNTTKNLGKEKAAVFEAHLLVTTDPVLIEDTEKLIKEEKCNAANALEITANKSIATLQTMDDDYFRERAADVIDVRDRILHKILKEIIALSKARFAIDEKEIDEIASDNRIKIIEYYLSKLIIKADVDELKYFKKESNDIDCQKQAVTSKNHKLNALKM